MRVHAQWLARVLMALIFILSGGMKIVGFASTAQLLASLGWPAPSLWVVAAIVFELGGGLALAFGFRTRLAALALIVFLLPATFGIHGAFLAQAKDPASKQDQMAHILKNIALIGGLLKFYADGAGRYALDPETA
jgi:putative oxidoreductase